jgi:1-deoxy-D-xylulose-5-phosphate synthase
VLVDDAPTVIRFPKGALAASSPALRIISDLDVIAESGDPEVLIVSVGAIATLTIEVAERLRAQGIGVLVVDPRWVKPCSPAIVGLARAAKLVVTVEDGIRDGGVGSSISQLLRDHDLDVSVRNFGIPTEFLEQGKRAQIMTEIGLTAQDISRRIVETVAHRTHEESDKSESGSVAS